MTAEPPTTGSLWANPRLRLQYPPLQALPLPERVSSTSASRIDKAARDFETILLTQWLEQAREAFAGVPGGVEEDADDSGAGQVMSLGMESLAAAVTRAGGVGIARMMAENLKHHEGNQADLKVAPSRSIAGPWPQESGR